MAGLHRASIVDAAMAIVERGGYDQLSVRELARALGVTAPALYDHVESKGEILRLVAERGYGELQASYSGHDAAAVERLRQRALAYVEFARSRPELFRLMLTYRPDAVSVDVDNELAVASEAFDAAIADIRRAIAEGDLADDDPQRIGLILWTSTHGVAVVATLAPDLAASVAPAVVDAVLAGLAVRTGGS